MANPEHLQLLHDGVDVWNEWRKRKKELCPDLSSADLVGALLRGANLNHCSLAGAMLNSADLAGARLRWATLTDAHLDGADLARTQMTDARLDRADLTEANLANANLRGVHAEGARLHRATITSANLRGVHMMGSDLSFAQLADADLSHANLASAQFNNANLSGVNLHEATLVKADFERATLHAANLSGANLAEASLREARLAWTVFVNNDLRHVHELESIKHDGPSGIGVDTLYRSGGRISEVFLRGTGVPEALIAYLRSLHGHIEFHSCFISYSTKDQEFADRLHADLQAKGVRCWFAPEDLKIGDNFRDRIDESIRSHDKLLIVLSRNSITSRWVRREAEAALEHEDRHKSTVLFPIRIDDSIMETSEAWASDIRRMRNIGNFSRWNDHDSYKRAFDRLLRDLKSEGQ